MLRRACRSCPGASVIPFCDLVKMATMGFSVESMIRGYHEYQSIWENPSIGESLICEREIGNCYDTHAVAYGPLLPFLLSTEASITSATRSFAEAIAPGEIDELNDPVGSGKTLAEGRDLLLTRLKYFRIDMTNHSVVSSFGLGTHVFAHEMILKFGGQKLWRIDTDSPNSPKFSSVRYIIVVYMDRCM